MKLESYITMMDAFLKRRLAMTMNHGVQQEHLVLWKEGKNTETYVIILNMSGEIITDRTKAPAKLRYRVSNNSGTINEEFGKDQQAAYDFANGMNETATIRGYFVFKKRGEWQTNTVFIDHVFK